MKSIAGNQSYNREARLDAETLLRGITKFGHIVTIYLVEKIMGYLKALSTGLQTRSLDVAKAFKRVQTARDSILEVE